MLLMGIYFILLVSMTSTVHLSSMSDELSRRRDDMTTWRQVSQPELSSPGVAADAGRRGQFRREFKRSLVQIFGMERRPGRRRKLTSGGGHHVPVYMRWLYEECSAGRLTSAMFNHLGGQLGRFSSNRQKRHSQRITSNTVRSFTGI